MEAEVFEMMRRQEIDHWWFVSRRRIIAKLLRNVGLPKDALILEAGCGSGGNLNLLSEFGRVKGFELDSQARQHAAQLGSAHVEYGKLPDQVPFAGELFDTVCAFDVLEHIEDDKAAMAAISQRIRPGGHLFVTVPAFMFLWSYHDEEHHHFRRYTAARLQSLLKSGGLQPYYLTYYNTVLFPLVAVVRWLKNRRSRPATDLTTPHPLTNALLRTLMSSERHLMPWARLPFGLSLLALARRPLPTDSQAVA